METKGDGRMGTVWSFLANLANMWEGFVIIKLRTRRHRSIPIFAIYQFGRLYERVLFLLISSYQPTFGVVPSVVSDGRRYVPYSS